MIFCADPSAQVASQQAEIEEAILRVVRSKRYVLGPEVEALEQEFAAYIGAAHAVGVANGTDALEIAIRALDLTPGDEVITVSHTAVATVAAIEAAGAIPVLVDVDPIYYTLAAEQLSDVLTDRTRAVIAVHLYGQAADLDAIGTFCQQHNLTLIEDASQAHGAKWGEERLGSIGRIGCFSCYPTKNLGALGDAGLITTNDSKLAEKIKMLREYGWRDRYVSEFAGRNSRLDELQAAVLRIKLTKLDADNDARRKLAACYNTELADNVIKPKIRSKSEAVFHLYVVRVEDREKVIAHLQEHEIFPGIHYPVPVHLQSAYRSRIRVSASMEVTERIASEVLSLPIYPQLKQSQVRDVIRALGALGSKS